MIPILYQGTETNFTSNGLGRLADAISCKVTEERNGIFELEMQYPITGVHYDEIQENRIIYAKTEDGGDPQAFMIYRITRPINGVVTVDAEHISYLLNGIPVMPFSASSLVETMAKIGNYSVITCPFTFYTDVTSTVSFSIDTARSIRSLLGGESGSILDVYGSYDYKFDNFMVKLLANRGQDNGVSLRYGKNITELKNITNMTNVYTGIVPFWKSEHDSVYLDNPVVLSGHENEYPYKIIKTVDFSSDFDSMPTKAQLLAKAESYLNTNKGWKLKSNVTVSFVNLAETEDYKDIAPLERVKLCDTVHIVYTRLGVDIKARVVKTVYNVLLERYDSLELGESTTDLTKAINETLLEQGDLADKSFLKAYVDNATKLIQGGLGGHVVFNTNADGEPQEILIMDTDDINTAMSVIRMNKNGIGFSLTGYNGPFHTAWTIDGVFYADWIAAGVLDANLIKAGIIKDSANLNYWNMQTGDFKLSAGAKIGNSTIASEDDVDDAITDYDTNYLNQTRVFNKLTNNGQLQGIYMQSGELYINGTYIKTGVLDADLIKAGIVKDSANKNYWNMQTGDFKLSAGAEIGNSTIASAADVSGAVSTYDSSLNQAAVFNKLTNNGQLQGIYMQNGDLYINGSYIKTGVLDANLITAGTIKDAQNKNSWNLTTGDFTLSTSTAVGNSTVASKSDVASGDSDTLTTADSHISTAISSYDQGLNQLAVYNKLTNNGSTMGIWLNAQDNKLYVNASYISTGILTGSNGKFAFNMNTGAFTMKDGTLEGVTIQSDEAGSAGAYNARLLLDNTTSIKGYYGDTMHNLINLEQVISGTHQMTIDADTQLNIRTPHLYVTNQSAGTGTATVYETITDTTQIWSQDTTYYMIKDLGKVEASDSEDDTVEERWVVCVPEEEATPDYVYCTLPVYLKYTKTPLKYINGMLIGEGTATSVIV